MSQLSWCTFRAFELPIIDKLPQNSTLTSARRAHVINAYLTVTEWSYAARTMLVSGLLLPFHLGYFAATWLLFKQQDEVINFDLLKLVLTTWLVVIVGTFSVSAWLVHRKSKARWPAHMLIFGYGTVMFAFVYLFGAMGSPYVAYYIVAVLLILVLFDARSGAIALGYTFVAGFAMVIAESSGMAPPAPGFAVRPADVMHDPRWTMMAGIWMAMALGVLYLIIWMVAASRQIAIQQLATSKAEVEHLAVTDMLTGLANRRRLDQHLNDEVERAERTNTDLAVIISDVDHFKHINDKFGHLAGDHALKVVARSLAASVRPYDLVARFGGEEFVIIAPFMPEEPAVELAERLRLEVESADFSALPFTLTASFGVACYRPGDSSASLIERADSALYRAKNMGRNKVVSTD